MTKLEAKYAYQEQKYYKLILNFQIISMNNQRTSRIEEDYDLGWSIYKLIWDKYI